MFTNYQYNQPIIGLSVTGAVHQTEHTYNTFIQHVVLMYKTSTHRVK